MGLCDLKFTHFPSQAELAGTGPELSTCDGQSEAKPGSLPRSSRKKNMRGSEKCERVKRKLTCPSGLLFLIKEALVCWESIFPVGPARRKSPRDPPTARSRPAASWEGFWQAFSSLRLQKAAWQNPSGPQYLPATPRRREVEVELPSGKIYLWGKRNIPGLQHGRLKI